MALVTYDDQAQYLGIPSGTDKQLLEDLLVQAQSLFENEVGRSNAPYGLPAGTVRTEVREGYPGSNILTLDYPIAAITSIGIGTDAAFPTETITPSDTSTVVWGVGTRNIYRVDGGYWQRWVPSWVKVVYTTAADAPADVKLAIQEKVAELYLHRDKIGFSSVTRGARSWTMAEAGRNPSAWDTAVANHRRGWMV